MIDLERLRLLGREPNVGATPAAFWSVHAMNSRWVDWEWHVAKDRKGIDTIRPFPLDDPAVAPPPKELEHLHFRDRYMMAREALQRIAERRP